MKLEIRNSKLETEDRCRSSSPQAKVRVSKFGFRVFQLASQAVTGDINRKERPNNPGETGGLRSRDGEPFDFKQ
jgi:hypothetical protein